MSGFNPWTRGPIFDSSAVAITGGTLKVDDGMVGTPSIAFASAPTTGLYLGSAFLRFAVGGANSVVVTGTSIAAGTDGAIDLGLSTNHWKRLYMDSTNTGTVGAVTINKAAGRVNIAAAGTSVVVTNSLVTAASKVFVVISTADATAVLKNVVPAAGSFTITLNAATTAQTSLDFFVVNTD